MMKSPASCEHYTLQDSESTYVIRHHAIAGIALCNTLNRQPRMINHHAIVADHLLAVAGVERPESSKSG
jgi:hypothetical protein